MSDDWRKKKAAAEREAKRPVHCPGGLFDFGSISNEAAATLQKPSGSIRLFQGIEGKNGFGLLHIETNLERMQKIKGLGYGSAAAFVADVCQNYQTLRKASEADRATLVYSKDGYDLTVIVKLDDSLKCWSVTTAIPRRACRDQILWTRPAS